LADRKTIDPRIKLTLLPIASFTSFFISDTILLFGLIAFAFFLYVYSSMWKIALRFILFFVLLYCIELGLGKFCQASIVFVIYMFIYFASRMTLIAVFGGYITKTPLLMRMIKISDELSASALIRGLDSDENRVTLTELRFSWVDLMIGLLGALMIALVIVIQKIY